jgi:protein-disulfide isomerase
LKVAAAFLIIGSLAAMPAEAAPTRKPSVVSDWTRIVVQTPAGGYRMGNPNAKVKLVEYGSLACPHCRHFEETGFKPLVQGYVRTGRVSYEFRNFLLNAPDISVSLLAHCVGPAKFFPMSQAVFASQPQWFDKISAITDEQRAAMDGMTPAQRVVRIGELAGFPEIAARYGLTAARSRQCLANPKGLATLLAMTKKAQDAGVKRTPTFFINGKASDASTWEELEPQLKKAAGG